MQRANGRLGKWRLAPGACAGRAEVAAPGGVLTSLSSRVTARGRGLLDNHRPPS